LCKAVADPGVKSHVKERAAGKVGEMLAYNQRKNVKRSYRYRVEQNGTEKHEDDITGRKR